MTTEQLILNPQREPWAWPLDVTRYNTDPQLTSTEQAALAQLVARFERNLGEHLNGANYGAIRRLFRPMVDVLHVVGHTPKHISRAFRLILILEMHRRQSPFWAWTTTDWITILGTTNRPKGERHLEARKEARLHLGAFAFLVCNFGDFAAVGHWKYRKLANLSFGEATVTATLDTVFGILSRWGYGEDLSTICVPRVLCELLLVNRSPYLEHLTEASFQTVLQRGLPRNSLIGLVRLSRVLAGFEIVPEQIGSYSTGKSHVRRFDSDAETGVADEWVAWCKRWYAASTASRRTRKSMYSRVLAVGRWLARNHPEITSPADWTAEVATAYVAAVDRATIGEYAGRRYHIQKAKIGKPLTASAKSALLATLRTFFRDCQDAGWIERRFNPNRYLATPRAIRALLGPAPRVIDDAIWAKLIWAGLNLTDADLPGTIWSEGPSEAHRLHWYPLAMVRAVVYVWLFAGLRSDELTRLRVGCIRWLHDDIPQTADEQGVAKDAVCWLDLPVNKTSIAFTKPIDHRVGEAIRAWEAERPPQPAQLDAKTGELVHYLFSYRGRRLGKLYLNRTLIPFLCQKAGVPEQDARGNFTSHRARSTIANQLANARDPMSLYEVQQWLGHRSPASTIHYVKPSPTRLAQSFANAEYLSRNLRTIAVLVDREAIVTGAAAQGQPWRYYDLGHGYCSYDFFDQCPHRMACAKCDFYVPKASSRAQLMEARSNLVRMLEEIPLTDDERAAVEDGVTAIERLTEKLLDTPTPAGPTPRQLAAAGLELIPLEPV